MTCKPQSRQWWRQFYRRRAARAWAAIRSCPQVQRVGMPAPARRRKVLP